MASKKAGWHSPGRRIHAYLQNEKKKKRKRKCQNENLKIKHKLNAYKYAFASFSLFIQEKSAKGKQLQKKNNDHSELNRMLGKISQIRPSHTTRALQDFLFFLGQILKDSVNAVKPLVLRRFLGTGFFWKTERKCGTQINNTMIFQMVYLFTP